MNRMRAFFTSHPRFTTCLHLVFAVLPSVPLLLLVIGFVLSLLPGMDFYGVWLPVMACGMLSIVYCPGVFWLLSLLLYRFTHAVREGWSDGLRMALIRFNILGGIMTIIQVILIILILF